MRNIGRTRHKLAELLQKEFPSSSNLAIRWNVDKIYAATGWYRSSNHHGNDSYRWEAFAVFERSGNVALSVGSYDTMTACVKVGHLVMHDDGEISAKAINVGDTVPDIELDIEGIPRRRAVLDAV